jgi:hypothetical protein
MICPRLGRARRHKFLHDSDYLHLLQPRVGKATEGKERRSRDLYYERQNHSRLWLYWWPYGWVAVYFAKAPPTRVLGQRISEPDPIKQLDAQHAHCKKVNYSIQHDDRVIHCVAYTLYVVVYVSFHHILLYLRCRNVILCRWPAEAIVSVSIKSSCS